MGCRGREMAREASARARRGGDRGAGVSGRASVDSMGFSEGKERGREGTQRDKARKQRETPRLGATGKQGEE